MVLYQSSFLLILKVDKNILILNVLYNTMLYKNVSSRDLLRCKLN
ncbi:hypothetical protein EC2862600_4796 [Escherichia coli 2862600]|nr:hypothetical protein EC2845350_4847 [Escherichia coli 2845350]ENA88960.1 hypothetical protein EC2862600_4796 [Escherichia coli 2862600]